MVIRLSLGDSASVYLMEIINNYPSIEGVTVGDDELGSILYEIWERGMDDMWNDIMEFKGIDGGEEPNLIKMTQLTFFGDEFNGNC